MRLTRRSALFFLPILVSLLLFVGYLVNYNRSLGFECAGGREGLTIWETIWDYEVFWGELWFNLLLALLFTTALFWKFPPAGPSPMRFSPKQETRVLMSMVGISAILITIMLITSPTGITSIFLGNWFSTNFAAQLPAWPGIFGAVGLVVMTVRTSPQGNTQTIIEEGTNKRFYLKHNAAVLTGVFFIGIWFYLVAVTYFHPYSLLAADVQIYSLITTVAYPICLFGVILDAWGVRLSDSVTNSLKSRKCDFLKWGALFISGLLVIVILQLVGAYTVPQWGEESMFAIDVHPWWPWSHWPGWLLAGTLSLSIYFGVRGLSRGRGNRIAPHAVAKKKSPQISSPVRSAQFYTRVRAAILIGVVGGAGLFTALSVISDISSLDPPRALVNQVGYLPNAPKRFVFQAPARKTVPSSAPFEVVDAITGEVVFSGTLRSNGSWYGHEYMIGNFSAVSTPGQYYARALVPGQEATSASFEIGSDVYNTTFQRATQFFYYQRCGYEVPELVSGYPGHHACHLDDGEVWNGSVWVYKNLTGGWHDAGDMNKWNGWFQTQWFVAQALAEASLHNPGGFYTYDRYDSDLPDVVDEALWGAQLLVKEVDSANLLGNTQDLVFDNVVGWNHHENHSAPMSASGPPEQDWTTPRRVISGRTVAEQAQYMPSIPWGYAGYARGYNFAATMLQVARMVETYNASYPGISFPLWAPSNDTLRDLGHRVYAAYSAKQSLDGVSDNLEINTGKFLYAVELGYEAGGSWATIDALTTQILNRVNNYTTSALWFSWASAYMMGLILDFYLATGMPMPASLTAQVAAFQENTFEKLYVGPFLMRHVFNDEGELELFRGYERATDFLINSWLQVLLCETNPALARPEIVQAQLDWLLGVNPFGLSMVESVGAVNPPVYHHRYAWAREPRGAVPGAIINGPDRIRLTKEEMARQWIENANDRWNILPDEPWVETMPANPLRRNSVCSCSNEVWIPHNAAFVKFATALLKYPLFI